MSWLEQKYINLMSGRLERFKRKSANLWNFRCPVCGDSDSNKSKARGYIYEKKSKYVFHCHNCGETLSLNKFIKHVDNNLYNEYIKESLVEQGLHKPSEVQEFAVKMKPPVFIKDNAPLKVLKKISQLNADHPAKQYVVNRKIPTPYHAKLFYCAKFKSWVNSFMPDKFEDTTYDEPRLIIPFINKDGVMFGLQGRSFNPDDKLRYITIMVDETQPRFYGLDAMNLSQPVYVFEGPIDSMFVPNSIASAGGDAMRELNILNIDKSPFVVVYDNEPRNPHTIKKIDRAIREGYKVCIWPNSVEEKDVNDMVLKRIYKHDYVPTEKITRIGNDIKEVIDTCTFEGLEATLNLKNWKKVSMGH
jgi:transcription elongation factor Elf1